MKLERLTKLTKTDADTLCRLLQMLSPTSSPSVKKLNAVLRAPSTFCFVLRSGEFIVATATLSIYPCPTGRKAWVEDVVVDEDFRNRGYGHELMEGIVRLARRMDVEKLMLTSKPSREEANKLYQSMNFERIETNVYQLNMGE